MSYLASHPLDVLALALQHLAIVGWGLLISVMIGVPMGILIHRASALEIPVMAGAGLLYITPSLALFAFLIPLTGLGQVTAIVAQVIYSLLVIIRNTQAGLNSVTAAEREAALALGLGPARQLAWVELPSALPVIVGGVRVAAVMGVGIASIAAYVGAGGLGSLVFRGIGTVDTGLILAGAIPIAVLALLLDSSLRLFETWLSRRSA